MTPEQAAHIQPGDVVYFHERNDHFVVGRVQTRGIAAPLFWLEVIGREDTHDDPGVTSYKIVDMPHDGQPSRAPYRGGSRYSVRTLRERGERVHPIPGEPDRPDERYLDGAALRSRREALNMSQGQLARALGIESNTLARWERGDIPIGNPVLLDLALQTIERDARLRQR